MTDPLFALSDHVSDLLDGYALRYHRWTDADQSGAGDLVLFRLAGTGSSDFLIDGPDVLIRLLCAPDRVETGRVAIRSIQARLYSDYEGQGAFLFLPMGNIIGPMYLQNERAIFDLNVRVMSDQARDFPD